jgi:hypothetical protein
VEVFGRQGVHRFAGDVGRVAEDEVEALLGTGREAVGKHQRDAVFEAVGGDVFGCHVEGVLGDVDGDDLGVGEGVGHQDRQAAGAGAHVHRRGDLIRILGPTGLKPSSSSSAK